MNGSKTGIWNWMIVDLDGTLGDYSHRSHLLKDNLGECHDRKGPDWDAFNEAAILDPVKLPILEIVKSVANTLNPVVVVMTGRSGKYAELTKLWLRKNNIPVDMLLMREPGDYRSDVEVKRDLYMHWIHGRGRVHFVLEDRDKVVEMWRNLGLTCLQVMKGEY